MYHNHCCQILEIPKKIIFEKYSYQIAKNATTYSMFKSGGKMEGSENRPLLATLILQVALSQFFLYPYKYCSCPHLTSLAYYHIVTINVLPKHALSSCFSGSLLSNVHHIICNSIMHCSTVYSDPFCLSLIFCNASSPIFYSCIVAIYNQLYIIHRMFRATERNIYFYYFYLFFSLT